jgi:hypothetical protein
MKIGTKCPLGKTAWFNTLRSNAYTVQSWKQKIKLSKIPGAMQLFYTDLQNAAGIIADPEMGCPQRNFNTGSNLQMRHFYLFKSIVSTSRKRI